VFDFRYSSTSGQRKGLEAVKIWKSHTICGVVLALSVAVFAQTNDDRLSAHVDEVVRAQMRDQNIPGVSLAVTRDGKVIKATGYGLANVELNVPMAPQMLLHTESLAKAFTATAVMMLVEEGKIGLDYKIAKYLPEAPARWNEVPIRRLLTHTSGIRDYFGQDGDPTIDLHRGFTEDELVRGFAAQTMRFPTGEKWSYCNAGYVILGVVIHRVTGKFWFDFVKERIFDPLGMTATRLISPDDIIRNRVSGYQMLSGEWKNEPWVAPGWKTADALHQRLRHGEVGRSALRRQTDQTLQPRADVDTGQTQQWHNLSLRFRMAHSRSERTPPDST
jgi:CubicO group peptidase (beta-lactamase class C family)